MRGWGALALAAAVAGLIVGTLLFALPAKAAGNERTDLLRAIGCAATTENYWQFSRWSNVGKETAALRAIFDCKGLSEELK